MTRFKEKIIVYYDRCTSSRIVVRIKRDFADKCVIILEAPIEYVDCGELGEICSWTTVFSHRCSFSSWQQYINRRYNERYLKDKEIYLY